MEVGDASSGPALKRVLGVLVDRLLARASGAGARCARSMLSARLLAGGGWRERVVFRQALADRRAHLAGAVGAPAGAARPGRDAGAGASSASALRRASRVRCSTEGARRARRAPARGGRARCAPSPGRTRRCAPSAWIPTRACPSGASCSRRCRVRPAARDPLNLPRPARVRWGGGLPRPRSTAKRSSSCASRGWWRTAGGRPQPLRRRYWEVVAARGRNVVVFHDLACASALVRPGP